MLGQLLVLGLPGKTAEDESAQTLAAQIARGEVGGTVLLRHNIKDRASVEGLSRLFVQANPAVLNTIDQEGGLVQRLSSPQGFARLPRARWVAENLDIEGARQLYASGGAELRSAGFNLNLAPSVDWHDANNPVIGKHGRSFGSEAAVITRYAGSFIDGMAHSGVACTLKHFPGHGTSSGDSHNGFVDISSTWSSRELAPFQELATRAPLVMGGHLYHPNFCNGELPVTFSQRALQMVLRHKLRFAGAVITDDLDMGAIRKSFSLEDAVIHALQAGNDLLLLSNSLEYDPELPIKIRSWVLSALDDGRLRPVTLSAAYSRVMRLKSQYAFAELPLEAAEPS